MNRRTAVWICGEGGGRNGEGGDGSCGNEFERACCFHFRLPVFKFPSQPSIAEFDKRPQCVCVVSTYAIATSADFFRAPRFQGFRRFSSRIPVIIVLSGLFFAIPSFQ
jgi:hypothetical protein